jgi:hypothetical protein
MDQRGARRHHERYVGEEAEHKPRRRAGAAVRCCLQRMRTSDASAIMQNTQ